MKALIYVLVDPRNGEVRYVGWTSRTLTNRLRQHVCESTRTFHRARWIQALLREGLEPIILEPIIRLLQEVPLSMWQDAERYWIRFHRERECPLTNTTDGGEGALGRVVSQETRAKIRSALAGKPQAKRSDAFKKKQRAWLLANNPTRSADVRAKISASKLGKKIRPHSDEQRAKMRVAALGRSPETRAKLRAATLAFYERKRYDSTV